MFSIITLEVRYEQDVVLARQRARQIAGLLGFDTQDQVRIATAVSEIVRNAFQHAGPSQVGIAVDDRPALRIVVRDRGRGIRDLPAVLDGRQDPGGSGHGIVCARRLMDYFEIESEPESGTKVVLGKKLPDKSVAEPARLRRVSEELARRAPDTPFQEAQLQNQELLHALEELQRRGVEKDELNRELEETNRGVVALYAELEDKAESLRRASEMKSRFLSNISHEFRTPLNSMIGLAGLLIDRVDGDLTPEQEIQVSLIRNSASTLLELVNDLLDLAKVEAGMVVVRLADFRVEDLFRALKGMVRPLPLFPGVELVFDNVTGLLPLRSDDGKIAQILRNFISNAVKFTTSGQIRVSASMPSRDTVRFSVSDTGIGIAPEHQEAIFEEFTQIEGPLQKSVKGTGLGLPLSRKLAELVGGSVQVSSQPGVGSTFTTIIPRIYVPPGQRFPGAPSARAASRAPVLLFDPSSTWKNHADNFRDAPFEFLVATNREQADEIFLRLRPVAIVVDSDEGDAEAALLSESYTLANAVPIVRLRERASGSERASSESDTSEPLPPGELISRLEHAARDVRLRKVLIVDDDEAARYVLKDLLSEVLRDKLSSPNCEIINAEGGAQGLQLTRECKPDLVFLDLMMPDLSGAQVLELLKSDVDCRHIPVVIHTSTVLDAEEHVRMALGAAAFLPKTMETKAAGRDAVYEALVQAGFAPALFRREG